jgi:uncharacterized protein YndB with AHSA1/START domain
MNQPDAERAVKKSIIVERDVPTTFRVWTEQIHLWWPTATHSLSGEAQSQVIIEGRINGRFYERATNGVEHDWGAITAWEPPHHLSFTWYLGSGQQLPTRVDVEFIALSPHKTRIKLEHRGPELIGDLWKQRVNLFNSAWAAVLSQLQLFLTRNNTTGGPAQ